MISLSATHRRRAYTKADQIVDIVSADFSEWEDILEGDTVVLTCKFRRRGADAIFYEVWEYFFSKEPGAEEEVAFSRVAHTGDDDADDYRRFNLFEEAKAAADDLS
jgi:hypothetical protein